ncbi:MAG: HAMP domain-containing sensor histidine kinase [Desulfuromonadaceae bacterium]|nr:HAMP domain-containing sensor histidine kinase [Desulfuromonadaceae bacterium]
MSRKNYHILTIVTLTILITCLHFGTTWQFSQRVVFEELYYLPLLLGVLRFGLKGAVVTWLFVSAAYLPFFFGTWTTTFPELLDRVLHLVFTGAFTSVACFLAERERKNRKQAEKERYLAGIGQVATVIVHDLKNPLISISGFARRLREGKGDVTLGAQTIENSAQDMQRIVNSVLDFARPLQLDLKVVDIRESIRRAGESCRTKADARNVPLTMQLPATPATIAIDSFHIERALVNLIDNAVDASQPGAVVTIAVAIDRDYIAIIIKDHGAGMGRETLANLFMPFYTTKNDGTGLGMPISKKVIEAHAGTLIINSKQGVGTEAAIRLPYNKENDWR